MSPERSLSSFPAPNVAVDIAVLTVVPAMDPAMDPEMDLAMDPEMDLPSDGGQLSVLVLRQGRGRRGVLPGRFIRERRTIKQTVGEILATKLELEPGDISPTLLRVFDDPYRDERGWTLSLAHAVTLPVDQVAGSAAEMAPIDRSGDLASRETLGYDHNQIVREAVKVMRDRYETAPDPDGLLRGPFTLSELRRLHEAVLGERLRKDTFNRRMREQLDEVYESPETPSLRRSVGRPAQLYTRRPGRRSGDTRWRLPRAPAER